MFFLKLFHSLDTYRGYLQNAYLNPDGSLLITFSDRAMEIWSIPDGRRLQIIENWGFDARDLEFDALGRLLVAGTGDGFVVWGVGSSQ
jgi:hypothetical protein